MVENRVVISSIRIWGYTTFKTMTTEKLNCDMKCVTCSVAHCCSKNPNRKFEKVKNDKTINSTVKKVAVW